MASTPTPVGAFRKESDSLGEVNVPADKLWGAQTQRSLEHFSIGSDLIPREMITAYATLKKAAAIANHADGRLPEGPFRLITQTCDEILAGQHADMFPLHVWMTGSGTQFNMNVNEVISNRCCQLAGTPLGSKAPVHPNDHVNMAQSSNDSFPSAMYIAAAVHVKGRLVPAVGALRDAITAKAQEWKDIIKIGRTHMQDATPLTLGQEWSGYAAALTDDLERIEDALKGVDFSMKGPPLGIGEVGYRHNQGAEDTGLAGNLKAGGFILGGRVPEFGSTRSSEGRYGFYAVADQAVLRFGEPETKRHLGVFGSVVVAPDTQVSPMPWYFNTGLVAYGPFDARPRDFLSLGTAYGAFSGPLRTAQQVQPTVGPDPNVPPYEMTIELSYGIQAMPGMLIQPGVQWLVNAGTSSSALALGLNVVLSF